MNSKEQPKILVDNERGDFRYPRSRPSSASVYQVDQASESKLKSTKFKNLISSRNRKALSNVIVNKRIQCERLVPTLEGETYQMLVSSKPTTPALENQSSQQLETVSKTVSSTHDIEDQYSTNQKKSDPQLKEVISEEFEAQDFYNNIIAKTQVFETSPSFPRIRDTTGDSNLELLQETSRNTMIKEVPSNTDIPRTEQINVYNFHYLPTIIESEFDEEVSEENKILESAKMNEELTLFDLEFKEWLEDKKKSGWADLNSMYPFDSDDLREKNKNRLNITLDRTEYQFDISDKASSKGRRLISSKFTYKNFFYMLGYMCAIFLVAGCLTYMKVLLVEFKITERKSYFLPDGILGSIWNIITKFSNYFTKFFVPEEEETLNWILF